MGKIEELMVDVEQGQIAYAVLSFGGFLSPGNKLFAIPWNALILYSAVRRKRVGFHLLHRKDKARLRRKFTRTSSTQEVPCEETVRGYETIPDRLVIVEEQGLAALAPKSRRTIELVGFAARDAIDPIYFDRPYYWKRCSTLPRLFSPTVLDGLPEPTPLNPNALKMAEQLIQALAAEFHPKQYHNEYREALMRLIQQKTAARVATIHPMEPQQPPEDLTSLLSALQASLDRIYNLRKNDGTSQSP